MPEIDRKSYYTLFLVYIAAISAIGNWIVREQTFPLLLAYSTSFAMYLLLLKGEQRDQPLFLLGLLSRLCLFFSLPTLSDDLYRFIWDGTLLLNNLDPYAHLPANYLNENISGITTELYEFLNSPNYFTVYPPLNQSFFWIAAILSQGSWLIAANVLRVVLLLADFTAFLFLKKLLIRYRKPVLLAYAYWLNPLLVLEGVGNLHFESLVICFLLMGIYFFITQKKWLAGIAFGLSIGTKLLPLIYLPFIFLKGLKHKNSVTAVLAGIIAAFTLIPLLSTSFFAGMTESLDLYFHSFEFNASIYFLVREVGMWVVGYNPIAILGTIMAVSSLIAILVISFVGYQKNKTLPEILLFILTTYLLLATTVHPWYILPLLAFGLLAGYWYPVAWSFLIFLTYSGYHTEGFELPWYVLVIEYVFVFLFAASEIWQKKDAHEKNTCPRSST